MKSTFRQTCPILDKSFVPSVTSIVINWLIYDKLYKNLTLIFAIQFRIEQEPFPLESPCEENFWKVLRKKKVVSQQCPSMMQI